MRANRFDLVSRSLAMEQSRRAMLRGLLATTGVAAALRRGRARAVVGGYVEIHNVACPPGYDPTNLFTACHDHRVAGVGFVADGPGPRHYEDVTDEEGRVVFGDFLDAGTVTIAQATPAGEFADYVVFCSRLDTSESVPVEKRANGRAAALFELPQAVVDGGTGVVCDWYNLPAPAASSPVAGEAPDGGIGLLWSDWEQIHGPGAGADGVTRYEDGRYVVAFTAGIVTSIEVSAGPAGFDRAAARESARRLIPADAELVQEFTLPAAGDGDAGIAVERYQSAALAERLSGLEPVWDGSILVLYQAARIAIIAGTEPIR